MNFITMSTSSSPQSDQASSKRRSSVNLLSKTSGTFSYSEQRTSKNLSGISLKIKESAIELKSFEKQWNKLHASGILILNSIRTLKIESMRCGEPELYPRGLQERCDQLQNVVDKMRSCLATLEVLVNQLKALVELDCMQGGNKGPIHLSWSTDKFVNVNIVFLGQAYQEICNAYTRELALKSTVTEEVCHSPTKESLVYLISSWTLQPYLTKKCKTMLEIIFYETDSR
ncbi:Cyclin-dependent kinase 2-interacting protein [Frankliniella fusca]|uniref:Cyclin-dependent kinase 2-interacting protein n=1 Tax=Frankliniella fusca TaxID=407009 RepID=A0AAE1H510_9NEOP|nr:Cyclin-dependent kinase 2-interacting protein [Frankliniella fusca]